MKKILMFAPDFFEYDKRIKIKLEEKGYTVKLYDDFSTFFEESLLKKIVKKYFKEKLKKIYFHNILKKEELELYDICFIIKGDEIPSWFLKKIREKKIKLINYQWDEIERFPKIKSLIKYYDIVYTYSLEDSKKFNLKYIPFFYSCILNVEDKENKIVYIGSYRKERYLLLKKIQEKLKNYNIKCDFNILINSIIYLKEAVFFKEKKDYFKFKKINYEETMKQFGKAKAIIEILNKEQYTPTTRSIEAIGLKSKIITTCRDIEKYDYYHKNNYFILNKELKIEEFEEWLSLPYVEASKIIKIKYSLENWIKKIIDDNLMGEKEC